MRTPKREPCWTVRDNVVITADSVAEMAHLLKITYSTVYTPYYNRKSARSFKAGGYIITLGEFPDKVPTVNSPVVEKTSTRSNGPLLSGHITHRLGVYRGSPV